MTPEEFEAYWASLPRTKRLLNGDVVLEKDGSPDEGSQLGRS